EVVDDRCHWAGRHPMLRVEAVSQILRQCVGGPWYRCGRCAEEGGRMPTLGVAAGERRVAFLCTGGVARRVTRAAVGETLDEIGAAIPFGAALRVGDEAARMEIERLPRGEEWSDVRREHQP